MYLKKTVFTLDFLGFCIPKTAICGMREIVSDSDFLLHKKIRKLPARIDIFHDKQLATPLIILLSRM